jgi:DNA-binding NtrC family response regulator
MSKQARRHPVILVVDDEPVVLAAVACDLRRGFGERYRVVRADSGDEALEVQRELVRRGEQVALLVADQRMPDLSGTEYLVRAGQIVNLVPARWLDVERDAEARQLLKAAAVGEDRLPVALLENGSALERPTVLSETASALGEGSMAVSLVHQYLAET